MKITKIKEIQWWDPKARIDAVTYKVWVENNGITHLVYFTNLEEVQAFEDSMKPKRSKPKRIEKLD